MILDASAVLDLLLRTAQADAVSAYVFRPGVTLYAPELIDLEFTQVLRRLVLARECSAPQGREALDDFRDLAIYRYTHRPLLNRIWQLRNTHSAYDAAYLALAEGLKVPLLTTDGKLANSHGHQAEIILF